MNTLTSRIIILLIALFVSISSFSQHIFSEKDFEYKKSFLPYDVPYIFTLEDKHFVLLSEVKKNEMKLGRYDQYFFDQWEINLEFNEGESAPQVYIKGDSIIAFSLTSLPEKKRIQLRFRFFNVKSGKELTATNYSFNSMQSEEFAPLITFSEDKSKFVIYNYLVSHDSKPAVQFQVFRIGEESPIHTIHVEPQVLSASKAKAAHLSDNGDIFLTCIQASDFKVETFYWPINRQEPSRISNNFFFERPVDRIGDLNIVQQSPSSYFVSFTANIEEELIGFNIAGFNVVLKTVMFSHNQNLRTDEIQSIYENFYVTSKDQKKKQLEIPEILENFQLVNCYVNSQNDIIIVIENLELPVDYYKNKPSQNMPWRHRSKDDKFYMGGDMLFYCFTERGELKWKKAIQKTQFSQANGLGLSFISRMEKNNLNLLMYESSKGGNFYILELNTVDGTLLNTINLIPDQKFEFTKKYSCWLNDRSVILCAIAPANIFKRSLLLVEF